MTLDEWLETEPECIQNLAKEFPIMTRLYDSEARQILYVIGYTEDDKLIVSKYAIDIDYDRALKHKFHVCAEHWR
jgi:hypothetical protein